MMSLESSCFFVGNCVYNFYRKKTTFNVNVTFNDFCVNNSTDDVCYNNFLLSYFTLLLSLTLFVYSTDLFHHLEAN